MTRSYLKNICLFGLVTEHGGGGLQEHLAAESGPPSCELPSWISFSPCRDSLLNMEPTGFLRAKLIKGLKPRCLLSFSTMYSNACVEFIGGDRSQKLQVPASFSWPHHPRLVNHWARISSAAWAQFSSWVECTSPRLLAVFRDSICNITAP